MPKIGMEPIRRRALIDAAIAAIGDRGALDVTVSDIAGRAGVSTALAHHYFGNKDGLLEATMRALLTELGQDVRAALKTAKTPRERLAAIIDANFSEKQFAPATVAAWLAFFMEAHRAPALKHLLSIYVRRLNSNLLHPLRQITDRTNAERIAEGVAALIDGLYIRRGLKDANPDHTSAVALIHHHIDAMLAKGH
jgi:TetR/AcrR family transcriptional repressor of bet genes